MLSHKHDGKQRHDLFDLFALFSGAHNGSYLHKSKLLRATFYMVYGFSTILYIWYLYHPLMHTLVLAVMSMIHAQWKSCSRLFKVWCEVYLSSMKVMITLSIGHLSSLTEFLKWVWLLWNVQKNVWHYLKCYKALRDKGITKENSSSLHSTMRMDEIYCGLLQ